MDKDHVFFENYAGTWDRDRKENAQTLSQLVQFCQLAPGSTVLDVGSGTGVLLPYLQMAVGGKGQIEELDYSRQMLAQARKKFASFTNVTYTEKNILKYHLPEEHYDAIICLNLYPHIAWQKEFFIKKMTAALKKDGALIIMHDMPRSRVNRQQTQSEGGILPPVDIMTTLLVSAGLTVTMALDTDAVYLVKAVKKEMPAYEQYPEPSWDDWEEETKTAPVHNHTHTHTQTKVVMNRLARISGHIEAIKRMISEGRDCSEVLIQISAVDSALVSVGKIILRDHIDHCIVDAVHHDDEAAIDNLKKAISTFIK